VRCANVAHDYPTIRPTDHIFVGSKAPWFEITEDLRKPEE